MGVRGIIKVISCIVPVYKAEKTLAACLDCLIAQSYPDFEILLVFNGDSYKEEKIAEIYQNKDNRIRFLHSSPAGITRARNKGLDHATGDYICFCDDDDTVESNWMSTLLSAFEDPRVELSNIMYRDAFYDIHGRLNTLRYYYYEHEALVVKREYLLEIDSPYADHVGNIGACWKSMYKQSILKKHNIRFPDYPALYEDVLFNLQYLKQISTVYNRNETLYTWNHYYDASGFRRYNASALRSVKEVIESFLTLTQQEQYGEAEYSRLYHPLASTFATGGMIRMCRHDATIEEDEIKKQLTDFIDEPFIPFIFSYYRPTAGQSKRIKGIVARKDIDELFEYCRNKSKTAF